MIKQYECLDCTAINEIAILELRDFNNPLFCRISCYKCGSIKVCRIYPRNDQKFIINADLVAPYLDSRIVAMTEEQRKLEQFFVISYKLIIQLLDFYEDMEITTSCLSQLKRTPQEFKKIAIEQVENMNQMSLNLIEVIKLIDKIREN